jgi:signal transduction histidine kinase
MDGWYGRRWPRWWTVTQNVAILGLILAAALHDAPHPVGLGTYALLAIAAAGWLTWTVWPDDNRWNVTGSIATGLAGVALTVAPEGVALAFVATACLRASRRLRAAYSMMIVSGLAVLFVTASLARGLHGTWLPAGLGIMAICLLAGLARRQNDLLQEQGRVTLAEQTRSRVLAERAQLAREVHDVLAHSLGALSVQLESADALLEHGRTEQGRQAVAKAGRLAREGLAETRRAIGVLRGDPVPLSQMLRELAGAYESPVQVTVTGPETTPPPQVALALYRTAQESLTNARKYASGATVYMQLRYTDDDVRLTVADGGARRPAGQLADTGGGYGLTGLRERAELAGGSFTAGPRDGGWAVDVRIPR